MRKRIYRSLSGMLIGLMALAYQTAPAQAAMLENAKVTLSNSIAGNQSSYQFSFVTKTTGTIKGIKMSFLKQPSGSAQNPTDMTTETATLAAGFTGITNAGGGAWAIDTTNAAASDILFIKNADTTSEIAAGTTVTFSLQAITNPPIADGATGCTRSSIGAGGANSSSGSCYIEIITFNDATLADMQAETTGKIIDNTVIGFTVNAQTTVTATVDPTIMFTIEAVNVNVDVTDAGATTLTTVPSTYSTIPFSYLTVGEPELAAQKLYVKTNAQNGYSVKLKATTDADAEQDGVMKGQYNAGANNIDGFLGDGPGYTAAWNAPQNWTAPEGISANINTGFLGVNSTDIDTSTFSGGGATQWAPLQNLTSNEVMKSAGPDLGTSAVTISYAIEVNVYQPADTYTGYFQYNCVPTY